MSELSQFWWTAAAFNEHDGYSVRRFGLFSAEHFLWLGIAVIVIALCVVLYRRLSHTGRKRMLIVVTALLISDELLKYVATAVTGQFEISYLPFHLCSINLFVCLANTIRPTKTAKNILYALCLPGALIALLVPTWTVYPMWNVMFLHSETIHILLVVYPCLLLFTGFKPDYRELPKVGAFLAGTAVVAVIINSIWDTNFLFLNGTAGNPVLRLCAEVFGDVYQIGLVIILALVWTLLYFPWGIYRIRRAARLKKVMTAAA